MSFLIFVFVCCFIGILATAYWSIESIKAVANKFKLSDTFVGALFLSIGTSFPEFINSLVSGIKDKDSNSPKYAMYSFYNVTGANIWQVVFLVFVIGILAIFYKVMKSKKEIDEISNIFWEDSFLSWNLVFLDTFILLMAFCFPPLFQPFTFKGFNMLNVIFIGIWIYYLGATYKTEASPEKETKSKYFSNLNKISLVSITLFLWILFGGFAYCNFYISSKFPIDGSTAFGVILSFITSSPEFSVLLLLFKQKEFRIAVGGFFGSSLFNLTLPAYTNLISLNPIIGQNLNITDEHNQSLSSHKISYWLICGLLCLTLFPLSFWHKKIGRTVILNVNSALIIGIYVSMNILINKLV